MRKKVIFVAGVHGVGKGHLCDLLAESLSIASYSASRLIESEKKSLVSSGKVVLDGDVNQDHLVTALQKLDVKSPILLDGHFCLKSNAGFFEVPLSTFECLGLSLVILLISAPEAIHRNLLSRDGVAFDLDDIRELQRIELARAKYVSENLGLELLIENGGNLEVVRNRVCQLLDRSKAVL